MARKTLSAAKNEPGKPVLSQSEVIPASTSDDPLADIRIAVTDTGEADLTRMREGTRARLKTALTPGFLAELGVTGPADFEPQHIAGFVRALGNLATFASTKFAGLPSEISAHIFGYTDAEVKAIAVPGAKVANRYLTGAKRHSELVQLVGALAEVHMRKMQVLPAVIQQYAIAHAQAQAAAAAAEKSTEQKVN